MVYFCGGSSRHVPIGIEGDFRTRRYSVSGWTPTSPRPPNIAETVLFFDFHRKQYLLFILIKNLKVATVLRRYFNLFEVFTLVEGAPVTCNDKITFHSVAVGLFYSLAIIPFCF